MRAYVGQTRSHDLAEFLAAQGIGECVVRGELPPRRWPWFYDNGAFRDFQEGVPFDVLRWSRDMRWIAYRDEWDQLHPYGKPDFVVVPDVVGDWQATLLTSALYADDVPAGVRRYLVVQDGLTPDRLPLEWLAGFDGLFIGGSPLTNWKWDTAPEWIAFAREAALKVHIGRVGTPDGVRRARQLGADSIDSALPIMFPSVHLYPWLAALNATEE